VRRWLQSGGGSLHFALPAGAGAYYGRMRDRLFVLAAAVLVWVAASMASVSTSAQQPAPFDGPRYNGSELLKPEDYRSWMFLSSGLGMAYGPDAGQGRPPLFTNVFVNPSAYRAFLQTGRVVRAAAGGGVVLRVSQGQRRGGEHLRAVLPRADGGRHADGNGQSGLPGLIAIRSS
jgi:hypothetical protein